MKSILIIAFACFATASFAQTEVEGEVSGAWTVENSPYIVTDTTWVPENEELNIEPGVEVIFAEYGLRVKGVLIAEGTEEDSIRLIDGDPEIPSKTILADDSTALISLSYCHFDGGRSFSITSDHRATISIDNSWLIAGGEVLHAHGACTTYVSRSVFISTVYREFQSTGTLLNWGTLSAEDCEIYGPRIDEDRNGGAIQNLGYLDLERCLIRGGIGGMYHAPGSVRKVIDCDLESIGITRGTELRNCIIARGVGGPRCIGAQIINNEIGGNLSVSEDFSGVIADNHVAGNLIVGGNQRLDTEAVIENNEIGGYLRCVDDGRFLVENCNIRSALIVLEAHYFSIRRSEVHGFVDLGETERFEVLNNTIYPTNIHHTPENTALLIQNADRRGNWFANNIVFIPEFEEETNLFDLWSQDFSTIIEYNCFYGMDRLIPGLADVEIHETNIQTDPLFVHIDTLDFRLLPDSPCIDAGDPDSPEDPDGTRADIGAYWYDPEYSVFDHENEVPKEFIVLPPYPNPLNNACKITIVVNKPQLVSLKIFDINARLLLDRPKTFYSTGKHVLNIDGSGITNGSYLVQIEAGNRTNMQKITFLK